MSSEGESVLPGHAADTSPPQAEATQSIMDFLDSGDESLDVTLDDLCLLESPGRSPGAASSSGAATIPAGPATAPLGPPDIVTELGMAGTRPPEGMLCDKCNDQCNWDTLKVDLRQCVFCTRCYGDPTFRDSHPDFIEQWHPVTANNTGERVGTPWLRPGTQAWYDFLGKGFVLPAWKSRSTYGRLAYGLPSPPPGRHW